MNAKINLIVLILILFVSSSWCYTTVSTSAVHDRLAAGDTLILLDVRERSEYWTNHIAEPPGQLPLTPAWMPWNSGILAAQYSRLPTDIDIIVYCASGGRSAAASSFLESQDFTRIFNLNGGFSSWPYESRSGGYGDHSGKWILPSDSSIVNIEGLITCDTSIINFQPSAIPVAESIYIEFHFASGTFPIPAGIPESDCQGLFRFTTLDPFGLSLFNGDSLALDEIIDIELLTDCSGITRSLHEFVIEENLTAHVPAEGWRPLSFTHDGCLFLRDESILRRWYNAESYEVGITSEPVPQTYDLNIFPNPFNSKVQINVSEKASVEIYDVTGRLIERTPKFDTRFVWVPESSIGAGLYLVKVNFPDRIETRKILYLK